MRKSELQSILEKLENYQEKTRQNPWLEEQRLKYKSEITRYLAEMESAKKEVEHFLSFLKKGDIPKKQHPGVGGAAETLPENLKIIFDAYPDEAFNKEDLSSILGAMGVKASTHSIRRFIQRDISNRSPKDYEFAKVPFGSQSGYAWKIIKDRKEFVRMNKYSAKKSTLWRYQEFPELYSRRINLCGSVLEQASIFKLDDLAKEIEEQISKKTYPKPAASPDLDVFLAHEVMRINRAKRMIANEKRLFLTEEQKDTLERITTEYWMRSAYNATRARPEGFLWRVKDAGLDIPKVDNIEYLEHMLQPVARFLRNYGGHYDWEVSYWLGMPLVTSQHALQVLAGKPEGCPHFKNDEEKKRCKATFKTPVLEYISSPLKGSERSIITIDALRYRGEVESIEGGRRIKLLNGDIIESKQKTFYHNNRPSNYNRILSVMSESWKDYVILKSEGLTSQAKK